MVATLLAGCGSKTSTEKTIEEKTSVSENSDSTEDKGAFNGASSLGGENYAVIAGGNEEAAIEFLKFATSKEQSLYMMNTMGYISPDSTIAEGQFKGDPVYEAFVEEMKYAYARGPLPEWPDISDAISLAFNEVMTGASTPEDAAAKAQATIDGILGK